MPSACDCLGVTLQVGVTLGETLMTHLGVRGDTSSVEERSDLGVPDDQRRVGEGSTCP